MKFLVIDFETANSDNNSVCQVGIVRCEDGKYEVVLDSYINPNARFTNTDIHGISQEDVKNAPTFDQIYPKLKELLEESVVFNHNGSDKSKFIDACKKYGLLNFNILWLNSATVVRRTWEQFSKSGYGVEEMCDFLNIEYVPHNAAEDALATAKIITVASLLKEYSVVNWIEELSNLSIGKKRNFAKFNDHQKIKGELKKAKDPSEIENKDTFFFGKKVVVSGKYDTWPDRNDLAKILRDLGADIDGSIGKYTNILCAGKGVGPSKFKKMEGKINNGDEACILEESEILKLLSVN